jgi:hypothetical protein
LRLQAALDVYLFPEASALAAELDRSTSPGFHRLNAAVAQLVDEWSMVAFAALDYSEEDSVGDVLAQVLACVAGCVLTSSVRLALALSDLSHVFLLITIGLLEA